LNRIEPKEKVECIIKLLPYILPKIVPVEEPKEDSKKGMKLLIHSMFKTHIPENTAAKQS